MQNNALSDLPASMTIMAEGQLCKISQIRRRRRDMKVSNWKRECAAFTGRFDQRQVRPDERTHRYNQFPGDVTNVTWTRDL